MILLREIVNTSGEHYAKTYLKYKRKFPAQFFLPNKPQAEAIKAVGTQSPQKRIFLHTSGNGTGKTVYAINVLMNIFYPNCNLFENVKDVQTGEVFSGFFNYPLFNNYPKEWPHQVWYVSNKDSLDSIQREFPKWLPQDDYQTHKDGKNHIARYTFKSHDWEIAFKTIDQDPKTFESANISIVIFDEPPPQNLFKAAISRLRAGGIVIIPATPLFGAGWFVDDIINKVEEDGDKYHQKISVWENCIERAGEWDCGPWGIQKKGNLAEENIEFTLRNYDPDELEARRDGEFKYLTGAVYKMYDRKKHFREIPLIEKHPIEYMYRMIVDPHDRKPPSVIWQRFDKWGRCEVIREWPSITDKEYGGLPFHKIKSADPLIISDFVRIWLEIEDELQIPRSRLKCIMDPNFGRKPNRVTGKIVYEEYQAEYRKQGYSRRFITEAVIDDLHTGHKAVKALLKETSDGDLPLVVSNTCFNVDYSMRNYSYDDPKGKAAEKIDVSEKVLEKGKDFADLIRYSAVMPFRYVPLPPTRDSYESTDYKEVSSKIKNQLQRIYVDRPEGV